MKCTTHTLMTNEKHCQQICTTRKSKGFFTLKIVPFIVTKTKEEFWQWSMIFFFKLQTLNKPISYKTVRKVYFTHTHKKKKKKANKPAALLI